MLVKDPPDLVPTLPLPLAPPWLVTEAIKQAIIIATSVAEAVSVDFQSQSLPTKLKASVISSSDIAKLCVPTPPPKPPDPWFSTTTGKSYIVGEIAKPLIQTVVDFQVKKIPETFNSSTDYKNSFMPPLLEETHSGLYSNSLGVSHAPFCEVTKVERDSKQFKLPKSLFYQISFKSTKEYNSKYEPEPGYLIAFRNIKPTRVDFVNHIFCNLLPPVNLITNSFSQCQTCSCHDIPLDDAGKKLNPFSCPVTGSNLETCDVYENYVCVGGKTILFLPSFHNSLKLLPIYSPINITVTKRINLASLDEGVIIGVSFVVTPFPYHVIETNFDDTDQSDMHAQLFQGLSSVLHSMDQGLMCSSSCDFETMTEAVENSSLITDVRFSASMRRLSSSSFDKTVRAWDVDNSGYSLCIFTGHSTSVMSLDFHPNKDDLICSCDGDVVRLLHALCDLSSRDSKFEQIFFDDIKVATQMIEMVFFTLTVLAGYIQEGHAFSHEHLLHSTFVACNLYMLTKLISTQWRDIVHMLLAYPKVDIFMDAACGSVCVVVRCLETALVAYNEDISMDSNLEFNLTPSNMLKDSYAQHRTSLFVKFFANLHCFVPNVCVEQERNLYVCKIMSAHRRLKTKELESSWCP